MRARLRRWGGARIAGLALVDVVVSAVLTVVAVAGILTGAVDEGPPALTLPVAVVSTSALAWRTRVPVLAAGLVLGTGMVQTLLAHPPGSIWSLVVLILAMYSVAAGYREGTAAAIGLVFVGVLLLEERIDNGPDYLFIAVVFGGTWLLGRASRLWRGRVTRAEREREHLAALAAVEERVRIARELHDIVGHTLGTIAVQAEAAGAALEREPALAAEPVRTIAETARRSLREIREVLHLLRTDDAPSAAGVDGIATLVADARRGGVDVDLDASLGDEVPAIVQRALYRIVQEALANAVRHAPGAAVRVRVVRDGDAVMAEVTNGRGTRPAAPSVDGVGLVGIRERATALRGTFEAAPHADGFRVRVRLPLTPEDTA